MIYGKIDNTQFKLCDFYAAKEVKGEKNTTTTVKFQGILLKAEFKKELNATIYVCDKKANFWSKKRGRASDNG